MLDNHRITVHEVNNNQQKETPKKNKKDQVHEEVKPYKCKFCDWAFASIKDITDHISQEHDKKCFKCLKCQNSFSTGSELEKHVINVHESNNLKSESLPTTKLKIKLSDDFQKLQSKRKKYQICNENLEDSNDLEITMPQIKK